MEPCYSSSIVTQVSVSQALQLFVVIKDSGMALDQAVNHQVSSNWWKSVGRTERYEYCKCRKAQKESMKASVLILFKKSKNFFTSIIFEFSCSALQVRRGAGNCGMSSLLLQQGSYSLQWLLWSSVVLDGDITILTPMKYEKLHKLDKRSTWT